jgi:hypothetical protein
MTATQSTQRHGATLWRAACHAVAALRTIHDEQALMWELVWRPAGRPWTGPDRAAGLDPEPGRATADRPPPAQPRRTQAAQAMTGTPRPRPAAAAAPASQPGQRMEQK